MRLNGYGGGTGALLLLLLLSVGVQQTVATPETQANSYAPIQRHIVPDLTDVLAQQLKEANISLLIVLPGTKPLQSISLEWQRVTDSVSQLADVHDFKGFMALWFGHHKYYRWQQQRHRRSTAVHHYPAPTALNETGNKLALRVALLLCVEEGAVRSSQANLAAAIARRVRRPHVLTITYSTHTDKGDSLLVFDREGTPLQAYFAATAIFRDAFSAVYDKKEWTDAGGGSGSGSTLPQTATIRAALPALIKKYNIKSMIDSSCGSMYWMPLVLAEVQQSQPGFRFMGCDVVCSLINKHLETFKNQSNWNFQCVDYSNQPLPQGYDLVFSRDSLQHLPMHGAWMFLNNVKASGAKYLLVGSYIKNPELNKNIAKAGEFYVIDLTKEPFKLTQPGGPLEIIAEGTKGEAHKHMLLFDVAKMTWQDPLFGLV